MTNNLKLIFYLDYNRFTYSIFNTLNNCFEKITTHKINVHNLNLANQIQHIIETSSDFNKEDFQTLGAIDINSSTLIPDLFFDEKELNNYIGVVKDDMTNIMQYNSSSAHFLKTTI